MLTRRQFAPLATASLIPGLAAANSHALFRLATFQADVTPPPGTPLCIGLVQPAVSVVDPLLARGMVLFGASRPIVLCAIDWCEIGNADHLTWREELAKAAGTDRQHVAIHCVHQHDAPWADTRAHEILAKTRQPIQAHDADWAKKARQGVVHALQQAMNSSQPVTHVGTGRSRIAQVASNRRIMGPDGKIRASRTSATRDAKIRAEHEGLIDPDLRLLSFWNEKTRLVSLYYYATHPMSHYGQGGVSRDFVGMAREKRIQDDGCPRLYFTGCAGNITAGKYNDGNPANRAVLAERMYQGMLAAERSETREPLQALDWHSRALQLKPNPTLNADQLRTVCQDVAQPRVARIRAAIKLSFLEFSAMRTISIACLTLNNHRRIIHLPGEPFVEYQLAAQQLQPDHFVAVAGYGDGGPGYLPLEVSYREGGYEPTMAFGDPRIEQPLRESMAELLKARG